MRPSVFTSTRLLTVLRDAPGHVLLCAPSGFGKSVLLRQYRERHPEAHLVTARVGDSPEQVIARALNCADETSATAGRLFSDLSLQTLLVDDAWLLGKEVVGALLHQAEESGVRLLLAVRHTRYPRVHGLQSRDRLLVLDANELALTPVEMLQLGQDDHAQDVYAETLGWPHLSVHFQDPLFSAQEYLQDLLRDLDPGLRAQLQSAPMLEVWDAHLPKLRQRDDGEFEAVMNSGLPIVPVRNHLHLHPYLWSYLLTLSSSQESRPESQAETLLHTVKHLDRATAVATIEVFFERHPDDTNDNQHSLRAKVELLRSVGVRHLSPGLRDRLAMLLVDIGENDEAREVLAYQRDRGTVSSRTYATVARLANFRNDFVEFKAVVPLMHQHAVTDRDRARAYAYETLLHVRLHEYEAALRSAEPMYEQAVKSGNLELQVFALTRLSYCHQMMGHLDEAMYWAYEAIKLVSSDLDANRYGGLLSPVYDSLGDMLKDAGRHEEALAFVQEALALATDHSSVGQQAVESSIGYLYNTCGLIYNELGRFDEAVESFEKSVQEFERVKNRAGLLMPLTYICYPLYRQGQYERIEPYLHYLHLVISRWAPVLAEYSEYHSYLPLAEGLYALGRGNREEAAQAFARVRCKGAMTYDSVLLAQLYLCQLAVQRRALKPEQVRRLLEVLDARGSGQDITAVMFADEFRDVYEACARMKEQPERFTRILATTQQAQPSEAKHVIRLITLGATGLEVNGQRVTLLNKYPVYVLAYLALRGEVVTRERLGEQLWTGKPNSTATASSAVSMLRAVLGELNLKEVVQESEKDWQGQKVLSLRRTPIWKIELDVDPYLSPRFLPTNPDQTELWTLLEQCGRFLPRPRATESRFAQEVNDELMRRAHAVATQLSEQSVAGGERRRAVHALLLALRCEVDLQTTERLEDLVADLDLRDRVEIGRYLQLTRDPDASDEAMLRQAEATLASLFGEGSVPVPSRADRNRKGERELFVIPRSEKSAS